MSKLIKQAIKLHADILSKYFMNACFRYVIIHLKSIFHVLAYQIFVLLLVLSNFRIYLYLSIFISMNERFSCALIVNGFAIIEQECYCDYRFND
jgi:hypothetical protein